MQKLWTTAAEVLTVSTLLLGSVVAQQTSSTTQKSSGSTSGEPGSFASSSSAAKPAQSAGLATDKEKRSYALGMNIGDSIKQDNMGLDPDLVAQGLKDVLAGNKPLLTDEEAKAAIGSLRAEVISKRQADLQKQAETNKAAGAQFLADNKTKPGVVTLPSGLQYKILKEGSGPKPAATDSVICNYKGTLINGTEFDASDKHGGPATFPVSGVIKGWTEALQLMPVGSKWQLYVPSDLAYGERSPGPEIGPNSTLIFEVELLSIKGKDAPAK
jgi:FKBP-type peptidyl-prolyl cis-trans isomerase